MRIMNTSAHRLVAILGVSGLLASMCLAQDVPAPAQAPSTPAQPTAPAPTPITPKPGQTPRPMRPIANPPYGMFKGAVLPMIQRSVMQNVTGKIGQLGMDLVSGRLYVAAKNMGTVEMMDAGLLKQLSPITELSEPQGILVVSDLRRLVVSCTGDNSVSVFTLADDGQPAAERKLEFSGECDPLGYDAAAKRVYVGHGKNLGSFNIETGEKGPSLELPGMPEGFVVDATSDRVFVNIAKAGTVLALKRSASGELKKDAEWKIKDLTDNYPMAFDPVRGHLFTVTRNPSKLVVLDTKADGKQVAAFNCTDDCDTLWWDSVQKRIFAACGGGKVDVFQVDAAGEYKPLHQEQTNIGCRTSIFVPEQRRLVVAAPKVGEDPVFLYIFIVGP